MATANEIIDEFGELVKRMEESAEVVDVAKLTIRAIENVRTQAEELTTHAGWITLTLPTEGELDKLRELTVEESPEMETMALKVRNACIAAEFDETIHADLGRQLLARYDLVLDARKSRRRSSTPLSKMRAVGAPIAANCKCGWVRTSPRGDWTSIRYQAKEHGKECDVANPGRGDQLTNDLDRVRDALVTRRESPVESGGLSFTID